MNNANSIKCSIIICTHNRSKSLVQTLKTILKQDFQASKVEIIVVDNRSTDDTNERFESISKEALIPMRYFFEPTLGLSVARNTGLHKARGDIVAFIDDDALPRRDWISTLMEAYDNPKINGAGGDVRPIWPYEELPIWFHRSLKSYLGITNFNYTSYKELHYPLYPFGVNISFRRKVAVQLGGFLTELGRKGKSLISGEETELCLRIEKAGGKIFYVPNAVVDHVIEKERLTKSWLRNRAFCQGLSKAGLELIGSTRVSMIFNIVKRFCILFASATGTVLFSILYQPGLAFTCECKIRMSWGYMLRVCEACLKKT